MKLPRRDRIATGYVGVAVVFYLLWVLDFLPRLMSSRVVGLVVLALGVAASMTAVVPGFDRLIHGSKVYLGVTALIGLGASVAGIRLLTNGTESMLHWMVAAMVVLWLVATIRHVTIGERGTAQATAATPGASTEVRRAQVPHEANMT